MPPFSLFAWMDGQAINYGGFLVVFGIGLILVVLWVTGVTEGSVFTFLFATSPLWLPYISFHLFFEKHMEHVGKKFELKSGRTIFEIVLPPDVFKSPEAMEVVFTQLYNKASPDNLMETYLDGKRPPIYSCELVSKGGDVRFYMTLPNKNVYGLRDALYSQYPGVEVREAEIDYTAEVPSDLEGWAMMSFHMGKKEDSAFPIKTYIEFGLDKLPKEEEKLDPMTPMLEMLAGIRPNQQIWIQFLFKAHRKDSFLHGQLKAGEGWDKAAQKEIDKILESRKKKIKTDKGESEDMLPLTPGDRSKIEAMERNIGKTPYEFACRVIYLSKDPNDFDGGLYSRFLRTFAATEITNRNGLGAQWRTDFNYKMFSDPFGKIIPALKKQELREYKLRQLFPKGGPMSFKIMTAEELATIFHLPGKVAITPTLNRVQSTRGEAPTNLPTGKL